MSKEVYLYCPQCDEKRPVVASMYNLTKAEGPVINSRDHCEVSWEDMNIEGDFNFVCVFCGTEVASDLEDIEKKLKEKKNGED